MKVCHLSYDINSIAAAKMFQKCHIRRAHAKYILATAVLNRRNRLSSSDRKREHCSGDIRQFDVMEFLPASRCVPAGVGAHSFHLP